MTFSAKTLFDHNGRNYEVRAASDGMGIHVRAFNTDGTFANGLKYFVPIETAVDAEIVAPGTDLVGNFIEEAIREVKNGH